MSQLIDFDLCGVESEDTYPPGYATKVLDKGNRTKWQAKGRNEEV
jgi:hypothetical protein